MSMYGMNKLTIIELFLRAKVLVVGWNDESLQAFVIPTYNQYLCQNHLQSID